MRTALVVLLVLAPVVVPLAFAQAPAPITIDSRDDWLRVGVVGKGTAEEPFVIQGLRWDTQDRDHVAISIQGVPDHAIIREILVVGGAAGIVIQGARNITIENITVRDARVGIHLDNVSASHVTVVENAVGIRAVRSTISSAVFADNGVGVEGQFVSVMDSRFSGNGEAYVQDDQPSRAAGQPAPRLERVLIEGSQTIGVRAMNDLLIRNATFERNYQGVRYQSAYNNASVKGSDFGEHGLVALEVDNQGKTWRFDATGNYWGRDVDGDATEPSPFGRGPPISGPINYAPIASAPFDNEIVGFPGARFSNNTAPNITDTGTTLTELGDGTSRLDVAFRLSDPDGIAGWTLNVGAETVRGDGDGKPEATVGGGFIIPGNTSQVFVATSDMFANAARFNKTYMPPPPPPPAPPVEDTPPTTEPTENESPAPAAVGAVAALALAAAGRRRR